MPMKIFNLNKILGGFSSFILILFVLLWNPPGRFFNFYGIFKIAKIADNPDKDKPNRKTCATTYQTLY